jgi:hypothetical protein
MPPKWRWGRRPASTGWVSVVVRQSHLLRGQVKLPHVAQGLGHLAASQGARDGRQRQAARIPMMAITASSSIRVNARELFFHTWWG